MSHSLSRRGFLAGTSSLAAAAAGSLIPSEAGAVPGMVSVKAGSWKPFMDQYYDGAVKIITGIRDTQIENIAQAMRKAYELQSKGGAVYSDLVFGHFASLAQGKNRPGQPWVLPQFDIGEPEEVFDAMKPGDFLITHITSEARKRAKERGVYVAGVTNNYYPFAEHPVGSLRDDKMSLPTCEEQSNMVIDSQIPWYNGLVNAPQVPQFRLCPGSGLAAYGVYWACTAIFCTLIGSKGKDRSTQPAVDYLDLLLERFGMVASDGPKFDAVGKAWSQKIIADRPKFMVFGEQFQVSEKRKGNPFVSDAVGAASGSMIGQHYNPDTITSNDMLLLCSIRSRQEDEIDAARQAKSKGAYVAAFGPYATDGDASGIRLYKEVDDAFNTYSDESEGVLSVKGFDKKVCPTAGLTGLLAHWMLMAAWTDRMAQAGEMPIYWKGFHEMGGQEYDQAIRPIFMNRGY